MIVAVDKPDELLTLLGVEAAHTREYATKHAAARQTIGSLKSSYASQHYDEVFYALVRAWRPNMYLEFGVLSGYSLLAASVGLKDNGSGEAVGVDLFEQYEFNKDYRSAVQSRIDALELNNQCRLLQRSVYDVAPTEFRPDVLHVDISNNGDVVEHFFSTWKDNVSRAILFEGGGRERDRVEWMTKYDKRSMYPVFETLSTTAGWTTIQVGAFPTFTAMVRNGSLPSQAT